QKDVGITTVFVTHDQEEALVMSDRMVLMNQGEIAGQGTPIELFEQPGNPFVASFLGQSNQFRGEVIETNPHAATVRTSGGMVIRGTGAEGIAAGAPVLVFVKQVRVRLNPPPEDAEFSNRFAARVEFATYLGQTIQYVCLVCGERLVATVQNDEALSLHRVGDEVILGWRQRDSLVLQR
ncbi:MAG: TOBE domain-containing protein, partial [Nitrospinota bacterium]|nr:TOBE domain-containing protein [Nitrospinota bacterium]